MTEVEKDEQELEGEAEKGEEEEELIGVVMVKIKRVEEGLKERGTRRETEDERVEKDEQKLEEEEEGE